MPSTAAVSFKKCLIVMPDSAPKRKPTPVWYSCAFSVKAEKNKRIDKNFRIRKYKYFFITTKLFSSRFFHFSECASTRLLTFNTFEKGFEVSGTKSFCAHALYDFKKQRWTILYRFGEYLQQITFFISINKYR